MDTDTQKTTMIFVNGREKEVHQKSLTFLEIVSLAFGTPKGGQTTYTVTYKRGQGEKPQGSLVEGECVRVKKGMIFHVTCTDKS